MTFKELRERADITQFDLAVKAGLQPSQISRIETGQIVRDLQYGVMVKLAAALNTTPEKLAAAVRASQAEMA